MDRKELAIPVNGATYTEIHKAAMKNNVKKVKLYLDRGPGPWGHVDSQDWWGRTALYRSVEKNYVDCVKEILRQGADVNLRENWWNRAPLHVACENGLIENVQHLLAYGADVNMWAKEGWTPLMLATSNGHLEVARILLNAKANFRLRTSNDYQAIHYAAKENHDELVQLLIAYGADPNSRIVEGGPAALHVAAIANSSKAIDVLLGNDADVNARDLKGMAPLHLAAQGGCLEATHSFVSHYSCDLHILNNEEQDALDICLQKFRNSAPTRAMQQTLAYVRKAYSDEMAEKKPQLDLEADYSFMSPDKGIPVQDVAHIKESTKPADKLKRLQALLKTFATQMRDYAAMETRRRKSVEAAEKSATALVIENAMAATLDAIRACKAAERSAKAAMITATATEAGDYDDVEEIESLRKDLGAKKQQRWENEWKSDKELYLTALALHVENLDVKLSGHADGLSAAKWTGRFAQVWQRLVGYNWTMRPGSERETLNIGDSVVVRKDRDDHFYKGKIFYRYKDATYLVKFPTGDKMHLRRDQINLSDEEIAKAKNSALQFGDLVTVQLKGWDQAYEGYIVRINTDNTWDVKFNDGSKVQYLERNRMRKKPHAIPYYYFKPGMLVSTGKPGLDYFTKEESVLDHIVNNSDHTPEAVNDSRRREVEIERLECKLAERDAEITRLKDTIAQRDHTIIVATEVERLFTPTQTRSENYRAVRRVFTALDADGDGELDADEILLGLKHNEEVKDLVSKVPALAPLASPEIYEDAFDSMDTDGDGSVSLEEFLIFRKKLEDTRALFRAIDENGDGYLSKEELLQGLSRPEVRKLLYRQPELKEFTSTSSFEAAWFELRLKHPEKGVSLGELLVFARKVGISRRVFATMPTDPKGRVLKRDFLNRSTAQDVRLLLLKEKDLCALANPDEVEGALWDINDGPTITLDEFIRFSRKVAGLRAVFSRLKPVHGRIPRIDFIDALDMRNKRGDSELIGLMKSHPELESMLDGSYRDSFLAASSDPDQSDTATLSEILIFTRKLSLIREALFEIHHLDSTQKIIKTNAAPVKVAVEVFIKAASSRNKVRRIFSQEKSLQFFLHPRAIRRLLLMSCDADDPTLDADILMNLSKQLFVGSKFFGAIDTKNNGTVAIEDIKTFFLSADGEALLSTQPFFSDLQKCFLGTTSVPFDTMHISESGFISLEEFVLASKRTHLLTNVIRTLLPFEQPVDNKVVDVTTNRILLGAFVSALDDREAPREMLRLMAAQDTFVLNYVNNPNHCRLTMTINDELHSSTPETRSSNTATNGLNEILNIGRCLNYIATTLFPLVAKTVGSDELTVTDNGTMISTATLLAGLKSSDKVRESLMFVSPPGPLKYMVETKEFTLVDMKGYTPDSFLAFAVQYFDDRTKYEAKVVSKFYKASHSSTSRTKFDDMLKKGSNLGPGEFTTRTLVRETETLRIKGNADIKDLQECIDKEKKKLRRLLNRVFTRVNPKKEEKEFNLISREEFYAWVRPSKQVIPPITNRDAYEGALDVPEDAANESGNFAAMVEKL
jgi:ankyrin repeat protein/Ca2+-binding EF-hand superfamily protein